jgi:hypothetical protein
VVIRLAAHSTTPPTPTAMGQSFILFIMTLYKNVHYGQLIAIALTKNSKILETPVGKSAYSGIDYSFTIDMEFFIYIF